MKLTKLKWSLLLATGLMASAPAFAVDEFWYPQTSGGNMLSSAEYIYRGNPETREAVLFRYQAATAPTPEPTTFTVPSTVEVTADVKVMNSAMEAVLVEGTAGTYNVTGIGSGAFSKSYASFKTTIEEVILPEGITHIEANAFENFTGLKRITFPSTLTKIDSYAFLGCSGLEEIVLPENVTWVGRGAFENCTSLTRVEIKSTQFFSADPVLVSAGGPYFIDGNGYRVDPTGILPAEIFKGCTSLSEVILPASIDEIDANAFSDCTNLSQLTFEGTSLDKIDPQAFNNVDLSKVTVTVPSGSEDGFAALTNKGATIEQPDTANPFTPVTNETIGTITGGAVIALQSKSTTGGLNRYFNGAGSKKTPELSYSNLFAVEDAGNGAIRLKQLSTGKYVGKNGQTITAVDNASDAATFTTAVASLTDNAIPSSVSGNSTIRFINASDAFINSENTNSIPTIRSGSGAYSVWYVYTFTHAAVERYRMGDVTVSVDMTNGARYNANDDKATSTYLIKWKSNSDEMLIGASLTAPVPNIGISGQWLDTRTGSAASSRYTVESLNPRWRVKSLQFNYNITPTNITVTANGTTTELGTSGSWEMENTDPEANGVSYTLAGTNGALVLSEYYIHLTPRPTFTDGHYYCLKAIGTTDELYLNMESGGLATVDSTPSIIYVKQKSANEPDMWCLRLNGPEGNTLSTSNGWDTNTGTTTEQYWQARPMKDAFDTTNPVVALYQTFSGTPGYAGWGSATDATLAHNVYADTNPAGEGQETLKYMWELIEIDPSETTTVATANEAIRAARQETHALLTLYSGMLTEAEVSHYSEQIDAVSEFPGEDNELMLQMQVTEAEQKIRSAFTLTIALNAIDGRVITIVNSRREASGKNPYLTSVAGNTQVNTSATITERCKWMVLVDYNANDFTLYNLYGRGFIGTGCGYGATSLGGARHIILAPNDSYSGSVAMKYTTAGTTTEAFTAADNATVLNTAAYTDPGSAWKLELAAISPDQIDGNKYYRIRSNRGMWKTDSHTSGNNSYENGSLLGINTMLEDGAPADTYVDMHKDGIGTLWQLVDAGNGTYHMLNAAAQYGGQTYGLAAGTFNGKNMAKMSATPLAVKIVPAQNVTIGSYEGRIPYSVAIVTNTATEKCLDIDGTNRTVDDVTTHYGAVVNEYQPGNKVHNDGSVFYLEEATDAESLINAYIALGAPQLDMTINAIESLPKASAIWDTDKAQEAYAEASQIAKPDVTTVSGANHVKEYEATVREICKPAFDTAIGRELVFTNSRHGLKLCGGVEDAKTSVTYTGLGNTTDGANLSTIWVVTGTSTPGVYKLRNYGYESNYASFHPNTGKRIPWSDTGADFEFIAPTQQMSASDGNYAIEPDNQVLIHAVGEYSYPYLHCVTTASQQIVRWNPSYASNWTVSVAEEGVDDFEYYHCADDGMIYITHTAYDVNVNSVRPSTLKVTIATFKAPQASTPAARVRANAQKVIETEDDAEDISDLVYPGFTDPVNGRAAATIDAGSATNSKEEGKYVISIPRGYLKTSGGSYSQPIQYVVEKKDGATTVIDEITADAEASEASEAEYFNLQGQRVTRPAHGIYLMRRGNTVTKVLK